MVISTKVRWYDELCAKLVINVFSTRSSSMAKPLLISCTHYSKKTEKINRGWKIFQAKICSRFTRECRGGPCYSNIPIWKLWNPWKQRAMREIWIKKTLCLLSLSYFIPEATAIHTAVSVSINTLQLTIDSFNTRILEKDIPVLYLRAFGSQFPRKIMLRPASLVLSNG